MLQIRLSKGCSAGDAGGGAVARPSLPADTVTVVCPDHLVIADLPVAKSLGAAPSSTAVVSVKSVGRRSRRHIGDRVHFCVCCDFPIAIYGRLVPCEHAFCLTCATSDSSCYLCDERIQKIQTIKMMEGIFICAAPHCLKSFLKKSEFEAHVDEAHADLLQSDLDKDRPNETDAINIMRPSSTDSLVKHSTQPEVSTARAPSRPGFSPNSNSQLQDHEDTAHRHQSREPTPMRPPLQQMQLPFPGHHHQQSAESQPDNNQPPQGIWFQNLQSFDQQNDPINRRDPGQFLPDKQAGIPSESPFPDYPLSQPFQIPNYPVQMPVPMPMVFNPGLNPSPQFSYPSLPMDGSQQYYSTPYEMQRLDTMPEGSQEPGSLLGFPPMPAGAASFPDSTRQWNTAGFTNMQFESVPVVQGNPEGFVNTIDGHGRAPLFQGEYGLVAESMPSNSALQVRDSELQQGGSIDDRKGVLASQPVPLHLPLTLPPPPPLPPLGFSQQHRRGSFSGSGEMP